MDKLVDFSACSQGATAYGGSDEKWSIILDGKFYLLKLPDRIEVKRNELQGSYSNSPISENIGCRIFADIGLPVQNTVLGYYNDRLAVACEDFLLNDITKRVGWQIHEYAKFENIVFSSRRGRTPELKNVEHVLTTHPLIAPIKEKAIARFWDTFVVDALIGNFDRHGHNWGYLVNYLTSEIELAPVYDCGSCLFPLISDVGILTVTNSFEMDKRVFDFPNAALTIHKEKISYFKFLNFTDNSDCLEAVIRVFPQIKLDNILRIVEETPNISKERISFLQTILYRRYNEILVPAYERLMMPEIDFDPDVSLTNKKKKDREC
jgi:hypothetical protein